MTKGIRLAVGFLFTATWLFVLGLLLAGTATVAALAPDATATPAPSGQFDTGNDAPPPADWDSQTVVRGQCEFALDAETFVQGTGSYRADKLKLASTTCYLSENKGINKTAPYQRHTFHLRLSALPAADTTVWNIRTLPYASQSLIVHPDGRLSLLNGPTTTAYDSGANALQPGVWYEIRFDVYHHDAEGHFALKVDGAPWVEQTGLDTKANFDAFSVRIGIQTGVRDTMDVHYDHYRWLWSATPFPKDGSPAATPTRLVLEGRPLFLPLAVRGD